MSLTKYTLGDIALSFSYGSMPKEDDLCEEGYPVFSGYRTVGYSKIYNINKRSLVVVARGVGGTGNVEIAEEKTFLTNLSIAIRINEELADIDYLKYYLNAQGLRYLDTGAAQSQITINNLRHHKVFIPSIDEQKKIAAIITAYDKLVKTNNKRIKILEQMVGDLYKEWFVRFRFPGYKNAAFVDGLPKCWEIHRVKDLTQRLPFGKLYKAEDVETEGEVIVIDQSTDEYVGFHSGEPSHYASLAEPIALFGDHSCKNQLMITPFSLSENVIPYRAKNGIKLVYLYYSLKGLIETTEYKRHWSELMAKKIILAPLSLQLMFAEQVEPILETIQLLEKQNRNLIKQKNKLLPRLMSGKLEMAL